MCDELGIVGVGGAAVWFVAFGDGEKFYGTMLACWSAMVFSLCSHKQCQLLMFFLQKVDRGPET